MGSILLILHLKNCSLIFMLTFIGEYSCKVDAKGRFGLPAAFKKLMLASEADEPRYVIKKSIFKTCIEFYPISEWEHLIGRIRKKINVFNKKHSAFLTEFHRGTAENVLDASGRVLLPKRLIELLEVRSELVLIGIGGTIEIWTKEEYEKSMMGAQDFADAAEEIFGDDFNLDD